MKVSLSQTIAPWRDPSLLLIGARATAAVVTPLVLGLLVGQPAAGLFAALGGLNVSNTDNGGDYADKARTMLQAIGMMLLALVLAACGYTWPLLATPLMFVCALFGSLLGIYGSTGGLLGFILVSLFLVALGIPATPISLLQHGLAVSAGGLWAMFLALVVWPLRPNWPARRDVASAYTALADFLQETRQEPDPANPQSVLLPARAAVLPAIGTARQTVFALRARRAGSSPVGQALQALVRSADLVFGATVGLADAQSSAEALGDNPAATQAVGHALAALEDMARLIAALVVQRRKAQDDPFAEAIARFETAQAELRAAMMPTGGIRTLERAVGAAGEHMRAASQSALDTLGNERPTGQPRPQSASQPWLRNGLAKLRDNLTPRSLAFRHAMRLAVTATIAILLYHALNIPRGYWVGLTVMSIMRADFGSTRSRLLQRTGGTIVGGVLAALLVAVVHQQVALLAAMVVLGILAFSQRQRSFGLFILFLTPFILVMMDVTSSGNWQLAVVRVGDTLLGAALALAASLLLWPSWEHERMPSQLADAMDANRSYLHAVAEVYLGRTETPSAVAEHSARTKAQLATTNAAVAFQRLLADPSRYRQNAEPFYALVAANQRLFDILTTMAFQAPAFDHSQPVPAFALFAGQLEQALETLATVLRSQQPTTAPDFEPVLAELATQATPNKLGLLRFANRLAEEVAGMYTAAGRVQA